MGSRGSIVGNAVGVGDNADVIWGMGVALGDAVSDGTGVDVTVGMELVGGGCVWVKVAVMVVAMVTGIADPGPGVIVTNAMVVRTLPDANT